MYKYSLQSSDYRLNVTDILKYLVDVVEFDDAIESAVKVV